jgi:predicted lipoprotein with Yx(FWY)xxD motif
MRKMSMALAAVAVLGCAALVGTASADHATAAAAQATLKTHKGKLGTFLVNRSGRSLYLFESDTSKKSSCDGRCAKAWPPVLTSSKPSATAGLKASRIGTIKRSDGTTQVTYGGHPLYTFIEDKKPAQTEGEGSRAFGAEWYVVAPSGKKIDDDNGDGGDS